jgi:polysaccharide biosynthesis protein PslH
MRILFLTARLPYPPTRGDRLRSYHFLRVLSREHQITLLSFIADESESANLAQLRPFCAEVNLIHRAPWQAAISTGLNSWRSLPLQSLYYRSPVMQQAVNRLLDRQHFDVVYVHLFRMAQYVADRQRPYRILDLTDAISREVTRSLPYLPPIWRVIYRLELPRIERYEREISRQFNQTWLISAADRRAIFADNPPDEIQVVPNGVDIDRYRPSTRGPVAPVLAFVGAMSVFHNIDAAEFLVYEILPLVRLENPGASVNIIGDNPSPRVQQLAAVPGVNVTGHVVDLNAALNQSAVFVAPLRFAAGIQNKVLEAMAAGLPVVTTSYVNNGIEAEDRRHLLVADDAVSIAAAVVELLNDSELRASLGQAGREFVAHRYRWEDLLGRMQAIEKQIEGK